MEAIVDRMQDESTGVPVRTVKSFMSKVPSVFTGKLSAFGCMHILFNPVPQCHVSTEETLRKTMGKGKNTGNQHFFFSHNVFSPSEKKFQFFCCIYFAVCKFFQFGRV